MTSKGTPVDQGPLVEMNLRDGLWIIRELSRRGFDVTVASWIKAAEDGPWFLYVASKDVDERSITDAYGVMHETLRDKPDLWISPFDVKLISPNDPIARDLLGIRRPAPGIPTRDFFSRLGDTFVVEACIYAPITPPEEDGDSPR